MKSAMTTNEQINPEGAALSHKRAVRSNKSAGIWPASGWSLYWPLSGMAM